jgi:ribosomal protein L37AE/L43A
VIKKPEGKTDSTPAQRRGYKRCPECGKEIANRTKECPQCGHKFEGRARKAKREQVAGVDVAAFKKQMEALEAIGGHKRLAEVLAEVNRLEVEVFAPLGGREQAKELVELLAQLKRTL